MPLPSLTPIAAALSETVPFVGPETIERQLGKPFRARLGANESPFGPSPAALAAIARHAGESWKYGDPENFELRGALAAHHGVAADEIAIGAGIDNLLGLAVRLFVPQGAAVVTSLGGYPTLNYHIAGFGGRMVTVPYRGNREDIEGLALAARRENAAMVYLANPDNPMGTWWNAAAVNEFIASVPETTLILLDEAYGEFGPPGTMPTLDTSRSNVLRLRTFSKAHGMAGLRCGYAIGERQTIGAFNRVRDHFGINSLVQAAALAALGDKGHLESVIARTALARERMADIARANGLVPIPSATNFVAIDCGRDGAYARAVLQALAAEGLFIRKPMAAGLDQHIRISVGTDAELDVLEAVLPAALHQ